MFGDEHVFVKKYQVNSRKKMCNMCDLDINYNGWICTKINMGDKNLSEIFMHKRNIIIVKLLLVKVIDLSGDK